MENTMKYTAVYSSQSDDALNVVVITEEAVAKLVDEIIYQYELDINDKEFSQALSEIIVVFEGELCPKQITVRKFIEMQ